MKRLLITLFLAACAAANAAHAGDAGRGKTLYQQNCTGCHQPSIHTRPASIIHSLGALKKRVEFCETQNGKNWTAAQIDDVVAYLNKQYYRFK